MYMTTNGFLVSGDLEDDLLVRTSPEAYFDIHGDIDKEEDKDETIP